jgi:tripartite-type tricarboxylate transporter receptor subunit TctC
MTHRLSRRDATRIFAATAAALPWLCTSPARAETYPARPVRLLLGGAPGSVPDALARVIAERLATGIGQQVVVENRPGAGGILAIQALLASKPDGYTVGLATMSQAVFNSYLFARLPYDPLRDLEPIAPLATGAMAVAAHPGFPASTLGEMVALAKARGDSLTIGTAGAGSPPHVVALMLARAAGITPTILPYKSGAEGVLDAVRGDVPVFVDAPTIIVPQARAGKLKVLAVTGRAREAALPEVPTVAEAGLPLAEGEAWIGLVGPAGMPAQIVAKLNREVGAALDGPEVLQRLAAMSFVPMRSTAAEFGALIRAEHARWKEIIVAAGLKLD